MQTPARRWFRYGLNTLLILALLENIGIYWIVLRMRESQRQCEAREDLDRGGWLVLRECEHTSNFRLCEPRPPGPKWFRDIVGLDFLSDVTWVGTPAAEDGPLFDSEFDYLACFPRLRRFELCRGATDRVLARVGRMKALEWLELSDENVTDAGLQGLEGLKNLRLLSLSGTHVGDGLCHIKGLTSLTSLSLRSTQVTDDALANITTLHRLDDLDLTDTKISDKGIEHLRSLSSLRYVWLFDTQVTKEGVRALQEALPDCSVCWDGGDVETGRN